MSFNLNLNTNQSKGDLNKSVRPNMGSSPSQTLGGQAPHDTSDQDAEIYK